MNKQELIDFENEIEEIYKTGVIRGPIHLRDGNEDALIAIFENIKPTDYKFSTWANHLEALLSGIDPDDVKNRILQGESMAMNFPDKRFFTSAIVAGICPIAVGVASSIKLDNKDDHVYVFIGDMAFSCGVTHESIKYSIYNNLNITWILANNNKSVGTPTNDAWGINSLNSTSEFFEFYNSLSMKYNNRQCIIKYDYVSRFPHSGCGSFVSF